MKSILQILFLMLFACPAFCQNYFVLDTGYKYSRIEEENVFQDKADPTTNLSSLRELTSLNAFVLGARGQLMVGCTGFFLQGAGHYAWIGKSGFNVDNILKARSRGYATDVIGGVGYELFVNSAFVFSPLVGFSYDENVLKISHSRTNSAIQYAADADGARYKQTWFGPWVGFDLFFDSCRCLPITFDAGYEFHYGWSHVDWRQQANIPVDITFSYHTHLSDMIGHVFHLQGLHRFCRNWLVGARLQYTYWENMHIVRSKIPPPSETGFTSGVYQSTRVLTWRSFSATVNLGFCF